MSMNLARYLTEDVIKLEMETVAEPLEEGASLSKWQQNLKETILNELVTVIENGYRIGNRTKLLIDFINRERKATTGIGYGIAIPHIRSMQAKDFMLGLARSKEGYDFCSLDGKPSHLFFVMAAPPYDDNLYLRAFKALTEIVQYESVREDLLNAASAGEIIRIMRSFA